MHQQQVDEGQLQVDEKLSAYRATASAMVRKLFVEQHDRRLARASAFRARPWRSRHRPP
jgi:hypothetical protein